MFRKINIVIVNFGKIKKLKKNVLEGKIGVNNK